MKYSTNQFAKAERIAVLIVRFLLGTITPEDHNELDEWVAESDDNMRLFEEMTIPDIEKQLKKIVIS